MIAVILMIVMAQAPSLNMTAVAQGTSSGIDDSREVVVRSPAEWQALWKAHAGPQAAPAIDFSTDVVAAVFLGTRPTGGFQVEIVAARLENGALMVEYVERRPGADAIVTQVQTSPFHIVKLPRFDGPIRFRRSASAP